MFLIFLLTVLILFISFLCSLLEAVLLSVTPAYVAVAVKNKKHYGTLLEHLKDKVDRPLSAILTLNTVSHTAGSAAIGALVHEEFGNGYLTMASILLTVGILVLSEIIPKILGASYWKSLAPFAAYTIQFLILCTYPFVLVSEFLGRIFSKNDEDPSMTREEMIVTAEIGADEGTLHIKESNIIKNLLMLDNIFVSDIMTPRSVFVAFEASMTVEEVMQKHKPIRFSRIPVYQGNLDNIIGITHRYKVLEAMSNDQHNLTINEITLPIMSLPERMTVSQVIDLFIKRKEHLALAVDEYGIVTGLVTLEDAIETLLGVEIVDEFDNVADMRQYALEQWNIRKNQMRKGTGTSGNTTGS